MRFFTPACRKLQVVFFANATILLFQPNEEPTFSGKGMSFRESQAGNTWFIIHKQRSSKSGQKASSSRRHSLIWEPARNTNPGAPPKSYWITNSEVWHPARIFWITVGGQGRRLELCRSGVIYWKTTWSQMSGIFKALYEMCEDLSQRPPSPWSMPWCIHENETVISCVLLLLKFPGMERGFIPYSSGFFLQCPACHAVTDPFKY